MHLVRQWKKNRFVRRLLSLTSGTIGAQLLLVASSPVLTRLYTPGDFGVFAVFLSLVTILGILTTLRYELGIPLARTESEASALTWLGVLVALFWCVALLLVVAFTDGWLPSRLGIPALAGVLWILPLALFLQAAGRMVTFVTLREGTIRANAGSRLARAIGQIAFQISAGVARFGVLGLPMGFAVGECFRLAYLLPRMPGYLGLSPAAGRWHELVRIARHHWRYPVYSCPAGLVANSSQMLAPVLLAALYGPEIAGLFALGQRVFVLPLSTVAQAANQVFMSELGSADRTQVHRMLVRTAATFLIIGIAVAIPVVLAAGPAFAVIFGQQWKEAGTLLAYLAPLFVALMTFMPVSQTLNYFDLQGLFLAGAILRLTAVLASFALGAMLELEAESTILLYGLFGAAGVFSHLAILYAASRQRSRFSPAGETKGQG